MKPYLLNPDGEHERSTVSLFDMLVEYEKPLLDKVKVEQAKWDRWVEDAILPAIQQGAHATLLSDAGLVVTDPAVKDDEWFIFSDPAGRRCHRRPAPYAWEHVTVEDHVKSGFHSGPLGGGAATPKSIRALKSRRTRVGPWYALVEVCLHEPVWTVPGG